MDRPYSTATCRAACQLIDVQINVCQPSLDRGGLTDMLDCLCPDLNVGAMGHHGVRTDLLDSCTICNEPGLGNNTFRDYITYDVLCNVYNNPGMYGGQENAFGESESTGGSYVVDAFSSFCLPEMRGTSVTSATDYVDIETAVPWDFAAQSTAMSILAAELDVPVPTISDSSSETSTKSSQASTASRTTITNSSSSSSTKDSSETSSKTQHTTPRSTASSSSQSKSSSTRASTEAPASPKSNLSSTGASTETPTSQTMQTMMTTSAQETPSTTMSTMPASNQTSAGVSLLLSSFCLSAVVGLGVAITSLLVIPVIPL